MAKKKNQKESKPQLSAEEMVKRELEHERVERSKAGRLLRLSPEGTWGSIMALLIGTALLLWLLGAPLALAAVLGGIGAVAGAVAVIANPFQRHKRKKNER